MFYIWQEMQIVWEHVMKLFVNNYLMVTFLYDMR